MIRLYNALLHINKNNNVIVYNKCKIDIIRIRSFPKMVGK